MGTIELKTLAPVTHTLCQKDRIDFNPKPVEYQPCHKRVVQDKGCMDEWGCMDEEHAVDKRCDMDEGMAWTGQHGQGGLHRQGACHGRGCDIMDEGTAYIWMRVQCHRRGCSVTDEGAVSQTRVQCHR